MTGAPPRTAQARLASLVATARPVGVRRFLALALALVPLTLLQLVHRLGFALDRILYPDFDQTTVREPLFVVGMPRSGTSFLHATLARDTGRFTTLRLWELVLAPSISERAFWTALLRLDVSLGSPATRLGRSLERRLMERMDGVHPVDFEEPGEDFLFLLPHFACFLLVALFPTSPTVWTLTRIDDWPAERRLDLLRRYRSCLQRHLYWVEREAARGGTPAARPLRVLSKNPSFTACVRTLGELFPDARFVCCFRPVEEALPSQLSSLRPAADAFAWDGGDPVYVNRFVTMYEEFARRSIELAERTGRSTTAVLELGELAADPAAAVASLYADFGWTPGDAFTDVLHERSRRSAAYRSRHRYDLGEFGLSRHELDERFSASIARLRALARARRGKGSASAEVVA